MAAKKTNKRGLETARDAGSELAPARWIAEMETELKRANQNLRNKDAGNKLYWEWHGYKNGILVALASNRRLSAIGLMSRAVSTEEND